MKTMKYLVLIATAVFVARVIYMYSGLYPMGADVPHNKLTYWVLETTREQSIANASKNIEVPPLGDASLLLSGGPDYNDTLSKRLAENGDANIRAGTEENMEKLKRFLARIRGYYLSAKP